jgi:hypothetical protein
MEYRLGEFEEHLNSFNKGSLCRRYDERFTANVGPESENADWRTLTIECAEWMKPPRNAYPGRVADKIWTFMALLLPHPTERSSEAHEDLRNRLLKFCTDSYNFSLMIRRTKDVYRCKIPIPRGKYDDKAASFQDGENYTKGDSVLNQFTCVKFTIFGALSRQKEHDPKDMVVLEKAHVVITDI